MDIGLPELTEPIRPRLGYVALLDVLGFKGVWQQHKDMTLVLEKMRHVANAGKVQEDLYNRDFLKVAGGKPTCTVSFFSDTIVVTIQFGSDDPDFEPDEKSKRFILSWILFIVRQVMVEWITGWPIRNLRGCITCGSFVAQEPFFVGEAIDTAAQLYEQADGAYIWLTPQAKPIFDGDDSDVIDLSSNRLVSYQVPLKAGPFTTWVLDSTAPTKNLNREQMQEATMLGFDTPMATSILPYSCTRFFWSSLSDQDYGRVKIQKWIISQ